MIALDSWIFLEYFTLGSKYIKCKKLLLSKSKKIISAITIMEIKYKGTKIVGKKRVREFLQDITTSPSVIIVDVNKKIAEKSADLRLKYYKRGIREVSYADMINLATAILTKCSKFYTGDPDFKNINEIKTIVL